MGSEALASADRAVVGVHPLGGLRASVGKMFLDGVTSLVPASAVNGIITLREKDKVEVAIGEQRLDAAKRIFAQTGQKVDGVRAHPPVRTTQECEQILEAAHSLVLGMPREMDQPRAQRRGPCSGCSVRRRGQGQSHKGASAGSRNADFRVRTVSGSPTPSSTSKS